MERLATQLALHGAAVLTASLVAGLFLHKAIRLDREASAWHLVHAGGSARGVLLIALAATIQLVALPLWQLFVFVWLMIFFAWTSMLAMVLAAGSGERGLSWKGSGTNKLVYALYVVGAIAVFPAAFLLVVGLLNAL